MCCLHAHAHTYSSVSYPARNLHENVRWWGGRGHMQSEEREKGEEEYLAHQIFVCRLKVV